MRGQEKAHDPQARLGADRGKHIGVARSELRVVSPGHGCLLFRLFDNSRNIEKLNSPWLI
jgi:hypothetical protein